MVVDNPLQETSVINVKLVIQFIIEKHNQTR